MTPAQVEEAARRRYNAVNQTSFYSQDELFKVIWEAETILAQEANVIHDVDTSITTVASTRSYSFPTNTLSIYRIEYDGNKLQKISFREDDQITLDNSDTTSEGTPQYYQEFDETIYLRPIPDSAKTLKVFRYKIPTLLTTASTSLSVPTWCHHFLIDYVAAHLALKDENTNSYNAYFNRWILNVDRARAIAKQKIRGDAMAYVRDEETLNQTIIGIV